MDDQNFILCDGLVKIFKVANLEVVALQGLDLVVHRGELLGVVGASGSGKSTLMNILGGLDRPSAGRVFVDGRDLLKMSDADLNPYRSTKVGFVWQQGARNLISYLSALENVKLPIIIAGRVTRETNKRAEMLLDAVGLAERKHHRLVEMSGGEQQRVAIAVALANNPALLLADEPTGEVDTNTAIQIFNIFKDLNRQFGLTTIIVSHDQTIARHVDRVVAIRDGKTSSETVRQTVSRAAAAGAARRAEGGIEAQPMRSKPRGNDLRRSDPAGCRRTPADPARIPGAFQHPAARVCGNGRRWHSHPPGAAQRARAGPGGCHRRQNRRARKRERRLRGLLGRLRKPAPAGGSHER